MTDQSGWWSRVASRVSQRWPEGLLVMAARRPWMSLVTLVVVAALTSVAVVASGLIPLRASGGHWRITNWLLEFSMERSVATHAIGIEPPSLDDAALVLRGATHYDLGCSPCHGAVRGSTPRIAGAMLPPPPSLPLVIPHWSAAELFYLVKHGVKFTGMPAWPAQQRDDEVWAIVAFLRRLPELDVPEYERLAHAETPGALWDLASGSNTGATPPSVIVHTCARCHGVDGLGRGVGAFPVLAGQRADYMRNALLAYGNGKRHSGIMGPIAASLSAEQREQVVRHYANRSWPGDEPATSGVPATDSPGQTIALRGLPDRMIPPCASCHGAADAVAYPAYPRLSGQPAPYLTQQLRLLQQRQRGGSEYAHLMHAFVDRLSSDHIRDVSAYFASLK